MSTKRNEISLVGPVKHSNTGCKLLSTSGVLKVLLYNIWYGKFSLSESIRFVLQEVLTYFIKARIPTKKLDKCWTKLNKLYANWNGLLEIK